MDKALIISIILVVVLSAVAAVLAYFLLRKPKSPNENNLLFPSDFIFDIRDCKKL
jgi:flagellar basal body-associated protein FliL